MKLVPSEKDRNDPQRKSTGDVLRDAPFIANSVPMREALMEARKAAEGGGILHLVGETGAGKGRTVRELHAEGCFGPGPIVVWSVPETPAMLHHSYLFGHEKGAFTGAEAGRKGLLSSADGGTLLVDDLDHITIEVQHALLRILDDAELGPLGRDGRSRIHLRWVLCSQKSLFELQRERRVLPDIAYRLRPAVVRIPALRDRPADLRELAGHLLDRYAEAYGTGAKEFGEDAAAFLESHPWPGNVREIAGAIGNAVLRRKERVIRAEDLRAEEPPPEAHSLQCPHCGRPPLTREAIVAALNEAGGVKRRAARLLNVSERTFHRQWKELVGV